MDEHLITRVRKLSQQYAYTSIRMHEAVAARAGLSGTDHKYLGFLLRDGAMTAGALALACGLTTGAVTGLIDRLETRGLVRREAFGDDRRKVLIVPETATIMALLEPLYREFRASSATLLESFTARELRTIERYFNGAVAIMDQAVDQLGAG